MPIVLALLRQGTIKRFRFELEEALKPTSMASKASTSHSTTSLPLLVDPSKSLALKKPKKPKKHGTSSKLGSKALIEKSRPKSPVQLASDASSVLKPPQDWALSVGAISGSVGGSYSCPTAHYSTFLLCDFYSFSSIVAKRQTTVSVE